MRVLSFIALFFAVYLFSQPLTQHTHFTKQDTLRGSNTEYRNWWDVQHYAIKIRPDFDQKHIKGWVEIKIKKTERTSTKGILQIDLQEPMQINAMEWSLDDANVIHILGPQKWKRDGNVYFVDMAKFSNSKDSVAYLNIDFSGNPKVAKMPPWDGGWVFARDDKGRPWMSLACQGLGASVWFPNKDYQGDEPDEGAEIKLQIPKAMQGVANGKKIKEEAYSSDLKEVTWQVVNPINNYNIVPYIGYYQHFSDSYNGLKGDLPLDYHVLDYNVDIAKTHFREDVKPMLDCFEDWLGPYPFYEDGFKLVESPYLGMEHQSNIAYGNQYKKGYLGTDLSRTGHGMSWDYIIVHEAGHEWFGNNITAKDIADMWIQEAFTTYTETLFVECKKGIEAANAYVRGERRMIQPNKKLIGVYGVNKEGGNLYGKGANVVHTLRQLINDDVKFKNLLRDLNKTFYHKTVTTLEVEDYISEYIGMDLEPFFDQYLRSTTIPVLEIKKRNKLLYYRYSNTAKGFNMPIRLESSDEWLYPTAEWKAYHGDKKRIRIDSNFLVYRS